jgi:hypothetical protein
MKRIVTNEWIHKENKDRSVKKGSLLTIFQGKDLVLIYLEFLLPSFQIPKALGGFRSWRYLILQSFMYFFD